MTFIVKACGNKQDDVPGMFELIAALRERQSRVYGKQHIDLRAGVLVGQKHPSPDFIARSELRHIAADAPPHSLVVVTHLDELSQLIDLTGESNDATIQLHSKRPVPEYVEALKAAYPDRHFWHVIHAPRHDEPAKQHAAEHGAVAAANELIMAGVEAIVLDSYDPVTDRVGGTGLQVSRRVARRFRNAFHSDMQTGQLVLAGGLRPSTVASAVRDVQPDGVDANTGLNVSSDDRSRDLGKVKAFCDEAAKGAFGVGVVDLWA